MTDDPLATFKAKQKEGWQHFAPTEVHSTPPAAALVRFASVKGGQAVLDVGTGTGPTAITARRAGATVTGLDLSPVLLERAKENAAIAEVDDIVWQEGDVEALPFDDASFDVVLSAWGHMFAPRAQVASDEMLRVLRPGGTIAFATWPTQGWFGELFGTVVKYLPPPPKGVDAPGEWGDQDVVGKRLGDHVKDLEFKDHPFGLSSMSPQHYRHFMEGTAAPVMGVVQALSDDPPKLAQFRKELDAVFTRYFEDNTMRAVALFTRATKV